MIKDVSLQVLVKHLLMYQVGEKMKILLKKQGTD
jgi:hypothetical protein